MSQPPPVPTIESQSQPAFVNRTSNGLAVASLVTAISGFIVPLLGAVGVVLGILGLKKARENNAAGRGLAIAGVVVGSISTVWVVLLVGMLIPALNKSREQAMHVQCAANMRLIGQGLQMYAEENRYVLPADLDSIARQLHIPVTSSIFACPKVRAAAKTTSSQTPDYVYAFKGTATIIHRLRTPNSYVMVYEPVSNHGDGGAFLFVDGHVEIIKEPRAGLMIKDIEQGINPPNPH